MTSIARDLANPAVGAGVWERFRVGRDESLWFYEEVAAAVEAGIGDEPLSASLRQALTVSVRSSLW